MGMGSPLYTTRSDVPTSAWNAALNLLLPAEHSVGLVSSRLRTSSVVTCPQRFASASEQTTCQLVVHRCSPLTNWCCAGMMRYYTATHSTRLTLA